MESHTDHLDSEELLHLALVASQADRHDHAIALLKQAWQRSPDNANIVYCLGAEHAQIGMYERAIAEMAHAVELDPSLDAARLQLGLLCLSCGLSDRGVSELQPLASRESQEPDDCYRHFAQALLALVEDRLPECAASLERGLALNRANPALSDDMHRLQQSVRQQMQAVAPIDDAGNTAAIVAPLPPAEQASAANPQSLWLSSYKKNGTTS